MRQINPHSFKIIMMNNYYYILTVQWLTGCCSISVAVVFTYFYNTLEICITTRQFINGGVCNFSHPPTTGKLLRGVKKKGWQAFLLHATLYKDLADGFFFLLFPSRLIRYTLNIIYHFTPCSARDQQGQQNGKDLLTTNGKLSKWDFED